MLILLSSGRFSFYVHGNFRNNKKQNKERREDLESMMSLGLARQPVEVAASALSRRTGTYDVNRHMYLRHTFVAVYCTDDGQVVDGHKHWIEAGGQSEHSWFVTGVHHPNAFSFASAAKGPVSGRPGKKHPAPKPTRSAKLIKMLGPPLHSASYISSPVVMAAGSGSMEVGTSGNAVVRIPASSAPSQDTVPDSQPGVDDTKCIARTWAKGMDRTQ